MINTLLQLEMTPESALHLAKWCWMILAFVWIAMAFTIKRAKRRESIVERLQYIGLLAAGFGLLFGGLPKSLRFWAFAFFRASPSSGGSVRC